MAASPPPLPAAGELTSRLGSADSRETTLAALEQHQGQHPVEVAMEASRALGKLRDQDAASAAEFNRVCLLLARLVFEAEDVPKRIEVWSASLDYEGAGGLEGHLRSRGVVWKTLCDETAFGREAALTLACWLAAWPMTCVRSVTNFYTAIGYPVTVECFGVLMKWHPLVSKTLQPNDDVPLAVASALLDLLRSRELPELAVGGAWECVKVCLSGRPANSKHMLRAGIFDVVMSFLPEERGAFSWKIASGKTHALFTAVYAVVEVLRAHGGEAERSDKDAFVSSGLFDKLLESILNFAAAGVEAVEETDSCGITMTLAALTICLDLPECNQKLRDGSGALGFCLDNSMEMVEQIGVTSGAYCSELCAKLFGRAEDTTDGSGFSFKQEHVDSMIEKWRQLTRKEAWWANFEPTADTVFTGELCVSVSSLNLSCPYTTVALTEPLSSVAHAART